MNKGCFNSDGEPICNIVEGLDIKTDSRLKSCREIFSIISTTQGLLKSNTHIRPKSETLFRTIVVIVIGIRIGVIHFGRLLR